jgi:hypothetical protein
MYIQSREATTTATAANPTATTAKSHGNKGLGAALFWISLVAIGAVLLILVCTTGKRRKRQAPQSTPSEEPWPELSLSRVSTVQHLNPWAPSNLTKAPVSTNTTSYIPPSRVLDPVQNNQRPTPRQLLARAPIPKARPFSLNSPAGEAPPYAGHSLPAASLQLPTPVARQDGRHPSTTFGGASRPSTPPPTYDQRVHDDLQHPEAEVTLDREGTGDTDSFAQAAGYQYVPGQLFGRRD